jgi:nucleoid DNA-binding protein
MKLAEVIAAVAEKTGIEKRVVRQAVEGTFETIKTTVDGGDKVLVPGMGSFVKVERPARERTSKTGETKSVPASTVLTFKPARKGAGEGGKKNRKAAQA